MIDKGIKLIKKTKNQMVFLIICIILTLSLCNNSISINTKDSASTQSKLANESNSSTLREYSFDSLGLFIGSLDWNGFGEFSISMNKTFNLDNSGPAILLIDFICLGEKPENPGYEITGYFNKINYSKTISRAMINLQEDIVQQIVIPLESEGRIFSNYLNMTIKATNYDAEITSGSISILGTSKLLIGEVLIVSDNGLFHLELYPSYWLGQASMSGIRLQSIIQFTISNESLINDSDCDFSFNYRILGDVTCSFFFFDQDERAFRVHETELEDGSKNATVAIEPRLGLNFFTIEISITSKSLWVAEFNITLTNTNLEFENNDKGFGFANLVIPFFNWPNYPIIGILLLTLWILPYSILKYREWKKIPGEFDINLLDDDEEGINLLDPEGLSSEDDDNDFVETYDLEDDF